jgi:serine/threonine protein kinase
LWAVGVTFYTFLHGSLPFFEDTPTALFASIQQSDPPISSSLSAAAQGFLRRILVKNVDERVSLAEIRESDWMAEARAELQAALEALEQEQEQKQQS